MTAADTQHALERIRRLLGARFDELAGAHIQGEIPLTDAVLNTLIAERLSARETPIQAAEARVKDAGEAFIRVRLRRPSFLPPVMIGVRIEQQLDLPRSTILGLTWWLPGLGALAAVAAPVVSFLKAAPPWVRVDGQHVFLDLAHLLQAQGAGEVLEYLRALQIVTREGALLLQFELQVGARAV